MLVPPPGLVDPLQVLPPALLGDGAPFDFAHGLDPVPPAASIPRPDPAPALGGLAAQRGGARSLQAAETAPEQAGPMPPTTPASHAGATNEPSGDPHARCRDGGGGLSLLEARRGSPAGFFPSHERTIRQRGKAGPSTAAAASSV